MDFGAATTSFFRALSMCLNGSLFILLAMWLLESLLHIIKVKLFRVDEEDRTWTRFVVLAIVFVAAFVWQFVVNYQEATDPINIQYAIYERYEKEYPMTWGYIEKNADDAQEYVVFYDSVWGKLQKKYGDGIIFGTLTPAQRRLVNFPPLTNRIYLSSKSAKEFHSTPMCYALLKSNPVSTSIVLKNKYDPCSKCVGD